MNPSKRPWTRIFVLTMLAALLLLGAFSFAGLDTATAQTKSFRWLRFDVDITLLENGDLRIVETQTLEFVGSFSNGYAVIYTGSTGRNDGIRDVQVREGEVVYTESGSGLPQTFTVSESGDETYIDWYFEPTSGQHTYTFAYVVEGAVGVEENGDQLFWNAIPSDHPGLIDTSRVTINLPEGVTAGSTTALVGGREGVADISVTNGGRTIVYELDTTLGYNRAFEVGVRFPHGQLELSTPGWQRQEQLQDTLHLLLIAAGVFVGIAGPGFVLVRWYSRGRDPEVGPVADYLEAPPGDLPPGLVGTLVDEKADMADIMATLVDLARRGYLTMEEKKNDFTFHRSDKSEQDLHVYEKKLIHGVFRAKEKQDLDDLKNRFYTKLPGIRRAMYKELVSRGLVDQSPEQVRSNYRAMGGFLLGGSFVVSICGLSVFGETLPMSLICPALGVVLTGFTFLFLGGHMPRKTYKGAETAARWHAFRRYLQGMEHYTDLGAAADKFEQYLPYAIAFGIERRWLTEFEAVPQVVPPIWYTPYPHRRRTFLGMGRSASSGSGGLEGASQSLSQGLAGMSSSLTRMLNSASSTFKSAPSSSSSGGGSSSSFSSSFSGGSSGGGSRGFS